jgi:hypothetical protein
MVSLWKSCSQMSSGALRTTPSGADELVPAAMHTAYRYTAAGTTVVLLVLLCKVYEPRLKDVVDSAQGYHLIGMLWSLASSHRIQRDWGLSSPAIGMQRASVTCCGHRNRYLKFPMLF